jgi:hypothetical protein
MESQSCNCWASAQREDLRTDIALLKVQLDAKETVIQALTAALAIYTGAGESAA